MWMPLSLYASRKSFLLIIISFLITGAPLLAQNNDRLRGNYWYFGQQVGMDFSTCSPQFLSDSQLGSPGIEGSASISDTSGNLVMYTDGETVWDRNHNVMPNGTGLMGNISTVQSSVIVPRPGTQDWYYIFTAGLLWRIMERWVFATVRWI